MKEEAKFKKTWGGCSVLIRCLGVYDQDETIVKQFQSYIEIRH